MAKQGLMGWRWLVPVFVASAVLAGCGGAQNAAPQPVSSVEEDSHQGGSSANDSEGQSVVAESQGSEAAEKDPRRIDERIAQDATEVWHGEGEDGSFFYFYLNEDQTWGGFYAQGDFGMRMGNGDISREGDDYLIGRDREPSLVRTTGKATLRVKDKGEGQMRVAATVEELVMDAIGKSPVDTKSHVEEKTLFDGELHKGGEEVKQAILDATRRWLDI